jgi:transcriptional regulator with XRE-family HTH domain
MKPDLLRKVRIQHGWSQTKVAEALGVDTRTVRRWEMGEAIPFPYYRQKLSRLFGKTAGELGLLPDSNEDDAIEEASPFIAQSTMPDTPAPTSFPADPTIPQILESMNSLLECESEVPAAQEAVVNSEVESIQAHPEGMRVSRSYPFSSRFFWDINSHVKLALSSRPFDRFSSRHLALIGSAILLVILVIAAVLPVFHWQAPFRSTRTQNHSGSPSTIAQAQASAKSQTTATFQNIYTQVTSGTPVINDSLSAQSNTSWDTYHNDDSSGCTFTGGALHCLSTLGSYEHSLALSNNFSNLANLAIEVSATLIKGDRTEVLLRWHDHTASGYRFYLTSDGYYTFEFLDNGDEHVLISQSSSAIHTGTGQSNTMTIIARKNTFYLYINKKYVNSISDSSFSSGQIAAASDGKDTISEVAFSNIRVWQL